MRKLSLVSMTMLAALLLGATACQRIDEGQKNYRNSVEGVSFPYPEVIMLSEGNNEILLTHSVPLVHPDPCDFVGDKPDLTELTDFRVSMRLYPMNLAETVAATQHSSFIQDFFPNGQFTLSEGYIREYRQGELQGYEVTQGVEGCGYYLYYFPLDENKTLVVKRTFITELSPISVKKDEYVRLTNVIPPEREQAIFEQLLRDFDYMKP